MPIIAKILAIAALAFFLPVSFSGLHAQINSLNLTASNNSPCENQSVTFTAEADPTSATGNVQFFIDGSPVATVPLSGGSATIPPSPLAPGNHTIYAEYDDGTNPVVTSNTLNITVNPLPTVSAGTYTGQCVSGPSIPLTGSPAGGTFSGTGVSGSNFNPATAGAGTHTITYTYTNGNGCTNSAQTTITVANSPATPTASLGGGSSCAGIAFGATTLSSTTPGATISWTGTNDIGFGTSGTGNIPAYTATNNTGADIFTDITVVASLNGCTSAPLTFRRTVRATPVISVSPTNQTVCSGVAFSTINFTNVNSTPGIIYTWSRDNTANTAGMDPSDPGTNPTSISGALINLTGSSQTSTFTITATAPNGCTSPAVTSSVTVNPYPNIPAIGGPTSVCEGSTIQLTNSTGGGTWSSTTPGIATVNSSGVVTGVSSGAANIVYTVTSGGCTNFVTRAVNVNPLPTVAAAASATTICAGQSVNLSSTGSNSATTTVSFSNTQTQAFQNGNPQFIDKSVVVSGLPTNMGAVTISLTVNVAHQRDREVEMYLLPPCGGNFGAGAGTFEYTIAAGMGVRLVADQGGTGVNYVNTTFTDAAAATVGGSGAIAPFTGSFRPEQAFSTLNTGCNPNGTWTLRMVDDENTGYTGVFNNFTLSFTYGSGAGYTWTSLPAGFTSSVEDPGTVTPAVTTTYIVRLTTASGCFREDQVTVNVTPAPTITLGTSPVVCQGTTSTSLPYTGTTGSPDQYSITWSGGAPGQGFTNVGFTSLPASPIPITVPAGAAVNTYNGTITVRAGAGGCSSVSVPFTVQVVAPPTITLGPNPSVCQGTTSVGLPYTGTTGTPNQYSIDWNAAAEGAGLTDVGNTTLPATPITLALPGALAPNTYSGTIRVTNSTTGCQSVAVPFTVTVNPAPTITLGANPTVCQGATSASLTYSGTTGGANQYSLTWSGAPAGFNNVAFTNLPASPITIALPAGAATGTYNAVLTVRNTTNTCVSINYNISVTIAPPPTITMGPNVIACVGTTLVNYTYTSTTNSPNQYSIVWGPAANTAGFPDVTNVALPASPIPITIPSNPAPANYTGTLTVRNSTTGCVNTGVTITIFVRPLPDITLGANPVICVGTTVAPLPYNSTLNTPNQYSIVWDAAALSAGLTNSTNVVLPASPINLAVPAGITPGTYNGTLTVRISATGCISTQKAFTLTVNPVVTPTFNAIPAICAGSPINLLTTSTNGITGTWSPAINNTATTTYTFTPAAGQCANTTTLTVTVNQPVTPTFAAIPAICAG
ncbi:hypothetical protein FPE01S_05_02040, partial [Flavihumibacter petaseus NBRC 106054]